MSLAAHPPAFPSPPWQYCDLLRRGCALHSRVAVDAHDACAGMRLVRPLRNIMRVECVAALQELGQLLQQPDDTDVARANETETAADAVAQGEGGGGASCIGDLMKAFVAQMQVMQFECLHVQCGA